MPSYYVLRGAERWHIYRAGFLLIAEAPGRAQSLLAELQKLGCAVVYGD